MPSWRGCWRRAVDWIRLVISVTLECLRTSAPSLLLSTEWIDDTVSSQFTQRTGALNAQATGRPNPFGFSDSFGTPRAPTQQAQPTGQQQQNGASVSSSLFLSLLRARGADTLAVCRGVIHSSPSSFSRNFCLSSTSVLFSIWVVLS